MNNDWNHAAHLLCLRLDSLGDVLMCTPAMRALRAQLPERRLTLLTSPAGAALAPHLPDVDSVLAYEAPWMKSSSADPPGRHIEQIGALARHRFDGAVIFTCYSQSALPAALLCQLAGIPLRAAYCREKPYQLLTDWIADPEPGAFIRHEVQRQLDLVRHLGAQVQDEHLSFLPLAADMAAVRTRLCRLGIDPAGRWLVLHPGASAPARRYPQRHWTTLIRTLHERVACPLVLTGGAHEMSLIDGIDLPEDARVHSLAGQLTLGELGALLAQSSLVVSNNTGPAHLAAAVGTPVVDLYALTNPQHTPWRVPSRVLNRDVGCRYCHRSVCPEGHHDCMEKLAPSQVADAVCSLLKQTEPYRVREGPGRNCMRPGRGFTCPAP